MEIQVMLHDMLWWPIDADILGECTACSFSIQQSGVCNIHADLNLQFMENRHCVSSSGNLFH
jgi:hypothetical protein